MPEPVRIMRMGGGDSFVLDFPLSAEIMMSLTAMHTDGVAVVPLPQGRACHHHHPFPQLPLNRANKAQPSEPILLAHLRILIDGLKAVKRYSQGSSL